MQIQFSAWFFILLNHLFSPRSRNLQPLLHPRPHRKRLHRRTDGCGTPHRRRGLTAIMRHMGLDQMTGGEGGAEAQFAGKHGGAHDAGQFAGVFAGRGRVGAAHAEEVEHAGLRFQDGAAADGADFDAGHGDGDLEVVVGAVVGVSG